MQKTLLVLVAITLSACTRMPIDTPPVMVTPNAPATAAGLDVYAGSRRAGNPVPEFRGQKTVAVRSFVPGNGPVGTEVAGATCQIDGTEYHATVITPATIVVPDYGAHSPDIFARCTLGNRSGTETVQAYNATRRDHSHAGIGLGVGDGHFGNSGTFLSLGLVANLGPHREDRWEYPVLSPTLR